MPTFDNPAADASKAEQALRGLAHATRRIEDPSQIYGVLGSLSRGIASLSQSLHQIAMFHDGRQKQTEWTPMNSPKARSAAYRVSWDLHRAGEMVRQVGEVIANAHEAEAILAYHREFPEPPLSRTSADHGLSL